MTTVRLLCCRAQSRIPLYNSSIFEKLCSDFFIRSCHTWLLDSPLPLRSTRDESKGVMVRAVKSEASMVTVITRPMSLNIIPVNPFMKMRGTKMATVVSEEAVIAIPTSEEAKTEASLGLSPASTCLVILSSTTMALSTTNPIAMIKLEREIIFIVRPNTYIKIKDIMMEKGMVRTMIRLVVLLRRKKRTTAITVNRAHKRVLERFLMEIMMSREASMLMA